MILIAIDIDGLPINSMVIFHGYANVPIIQFDDNSDTIGLWVLIVVNIIGLVLFGKILTGNPWVFTIKLIGVSSFNCPIIQFHEGWCPPVMFV